MRTPPLAVVLCALCICLCAATDVPQECTDAIEMVANGTYPDSLFMKLSMGNLPYDLGEYLSCKYLQSSHYCTAQFDIDVPINETKTDIGASYWGLCVPKECRQEHVPQIMFELQPIMQAFRDYMDETTISAYCSDEKADVFSHTNAVLVLCAFFLFGLLTIMGTVVHECTLSSPSSPSAPPSASLHSGPNAAGITTPGPSSRPEDSLSSISSTTDAFRSLQSPPFVVVADSINAPSNTNNSISNSKHQETADMKQLDAAQPLLSKPQALPTSTATQQTQTQIQAPQPQSSGWFGKFALCFSLRSNIVKLYTNPPTDPNAPDTSSLNGLRVFSMLSVVLGHVILFSGDSLADMLPMEANVATRFTFQYATQGTLGVDTFFWLSGLLATYLFMLELNAVSAQSANEPNPGSKTLRSYLLYYVHRIYRLTPVYWLWLFFSWQVQPWIGNGPLFDLQVNHINTRCNEYWYADMLYVSNLKNDYGGNCLGWSWYIMNDMQFSLVLPIIIVVLMFNRKMGWTLIGVITAALHIKNTWHGSFYDYNASWFSAGQGLFMRDYYTRPWFRAPMYLVGVACGVLMVDYGPSLKRFFKIKLFTWACFILGSLIIFAAIFWPYQINKTMDSSNNWSKTTHLFYLLYGRWIYTIGLSLLFFPCFFGQGEWLNAFLGAPLYTPLARLTYQAYLIGPIWIFILNASRVENDKYTDFVLASRVAFHFCIAYASSFISWLCIEKPIMNLETFLITRPSRKGGLPKKQAPLDVSNKV
eukprot:TRINITY_DN10316_c0_g1_i1.p1 TRINITY_DN10316_c0_g1~~TRINITY_DN10316_c0_g1_i1.p1  ORF type:complete len:760 (-),score=122.01 TRINITY_DN10316_c0_g1_i1:123-2402(-)